MGRAASAGVASAGRRSRAVGRDCPRGVHPERLSESGSPGILLRGRGAGSARGTSPLGVGEPQTAAAPRTRTHPQDRLHLPLPTDGDRTESHHRYTCRAPLNRSRINAEGTEIKKRKCIQEMHRFVLFSRFFSVLSVPSVLNLFGSSLDCRREESVGSVRGRPGPEKSLCADKAFDRNVLSKNPLERVSQRDDPECVWRAAKRFAHDELVFFRLERARRIDQPSVWPKIRERIL